MGLISSMAKAGIRITPKVSVDGRFAQFNVTNVSASDVGFFGIGTIGFNALVIPLMDALEEVFHETSRPVDTAFCLYGYAAYRGTRRVRG